jgi:chlorobactene glucosyltransferase
VALGLVQGLTFWWSWRQYSRLPLLNVEAELPPGSSDSPTLTVVVPARNEAHRIAPLLDSLAALSYPNYSVIVVDDQSTDATASLAKAAGFEVLRLDYLPEGWTGKNWACWNGARSSSGEWILFVDADIRLAPRSVMCAIRHASGEAAGLLSTFLQQECVTFWERLLLPIAFCLYFAGTRASSVNTSPTKALANGQFLLVRRKEYFDVGGHSSIRDSVIDDVALARRFRTSGIRVLMTRGESVGSVRMYRNLSELRSGFSKNAFQFTQVDPVSGSRTVVGTLVCLAMAARLIRRSNRRQLLALLAVNATLIVPWFRAFGVPLRYAFLHPIGALTFQAIALEGIVRTLTGTVNWKNRRLS